MIDFYKCAPKLSELEEENEKLKKDVDRLHQMCLDLMNEAGGLKKLIKLANNCIDDCEYSLTKVSNDRVEDAVNKWQGAYKAYKGEDKNASNT